VPVFRASRHIENLLNQIQEECASQYSLQIILVDDLSNDETSSVIRALTPQYPNIDISLISLRRNMGQAAATAIGLAHAKNQCIITMDDDLQHHPKDISELIARLQEDDLDFVVAKFETTKVSRLKAIARIIAHRLAAAKYKTPKNFGFSSFCAYRRDFIQSADLLQRPRIELGWMFDLSQRYGNVQLEQCESVRASSTYSFGSLLRTSKPLFRHLFSFLVRPIAALGLISSVLALAVLVYYFWFFIVTGSPIPGFATLSILMLLSIGISGIFLFTAMTELREIRSLVNERVSNSVCDVERTGHE
jgi:glycosyltransferase involved in cell wall biosynthesis